MQRTHNTLSHYVNLESDSSENLSLEPQNRESSQSSMFLVLEFSMTFLTLLSCYEILGNFMDNAYQT